MGNREVEDRPAPAREFPTETRLIGAESGGNESLPRILPFAVFMAFIGVDEIAGLLARNGLIHLDQAFPFILYPLKALATTGVLLFFKSHYSEIRLKDLVNLKNSLISVFVGLALFVAWINLDFSTGPGGKSFNPTLIKNPMAMWMVIIVRLVGASLIVPVMEELFWRSFLIRYLISKNYSTVPLGLFTWPSFIIASVLFGLEHDLVIAGIVAGITFNFILYRTKSIAHCILAHGVTNLALGVYVLASGQWHFW